MTHLEDLIWLALGLWMIVIPIAVVVVLDFRMMTVQGEAVERGHAEVREGKWMWRDEP